MTDKKYKYWLAVVDGQLVQFSELPHMMATALHPEGGMAYGAARINLEDELKLAVRDGLLRVRNPAGLGFHTFPHGDALQRAVLIPDTDLEPFLNARGIELRITPHGNGPDYWTLENAAAAMQEQLNWHDGTREEFQDQMQEAAASGSLVVLNPRTCLPCNPKSVRTYWEYVTPDSVNTWLATLKAPYRWNIASPLIDVPYQSPRDIKPWEVLEPFYEPIKGLYMYQQAAREIADAEGWNDTQLVALEAEMLWAINDKSLTVRDRKTGMESKHDAWEVMKLVTVEDVNTWLEKRRVPYRWDRLTNEAPARPVVTAKRRTWRDVAMQYIVETYRAGRYKTAHTFYVALVNKAEAGNSPFTLHNRELFLTDLGQSVAEKTIANEMPKIKAAARQPQI